MPMEPSSDQRPATPYCTFAPTLCEVAMFLAKRLFKELFSTEFSLSLVEPLSATTQLEAMPDVNPALRS